MLPRYLFAVLGIALAAPLASGCSSEVKAYEKKPAPTGKAANIPAPPTLPQKPKKAGDSFTIHGLVHDLHSKVHAVEVKGKKLTVEGYIVKTNLVECKTPDAVAEGCVPQCAVPKDLKEGTPQDCKAPAPTFWIADSPDEKTEMVAVIGWASNFAGIKGAIEFYDKSDKRECKEPKDCKEEGTACQNGTCMFQDQQGRFLPDPIPAVGAKVKVTGTYGVTFKAFSGSPATDPKYGILGFGGSDSSIEVQQAAPELATLPFMDKRKPKDKKDDKKKK